MAYYRFNEAPLPNSRMVDSLNLLNGTYPAGSAIGQRTWAVGGELRNTGLVFTPTAFSTSPITLPIFTPTRGLSLSFLIEAATSSLQPQQILAVTIASGDLVRVFLQDNQVVIVSTFLFEPKLSSMRLVTGALHHIIVSVEVQRIRLSVDGELDSSYSTLLYSWADVGNCVLSIGQVQECHQPRLPGSV